MDTIDETKPTDDAFAAGFDDKTETKPTEPVTETPAAKVEEAPEYVQLTKADWEAHAAELAALKHQQSKSFGTFGKTIDGLKGTIEELRARASKGEEPKTSTVKYDALKEQFPELADMTMEALQEKLKSLPKNGVDESVFATKVHEEVDRRELVALEDEYPNWREIVGAAASKDQVDQDNPFRKWLAGKDESYQTAVNDTTSAAFIERAIRRFQRETKTPPKAATPRAEARREQIAAAVTPKGDGAHAPAKATVDDAFAEGFRTG